MPLSVGRFVMQQMITRIGIMISTWTILNEVFNTIVHSFLFFFFKWSFTLVAQTGVQWCNLGSTSQVQAILLPLPPK